MLSPGAESSSARPKWCRCSRHFPGCRPWRKPHDQEVLRKLSSAWKPERLRLLSDKEEADAFQTLSWYAKRRQRGEPGYDEKLLWCMAAETMVLHPLVLALSYWFQSLYDDLELTFLHEKVLPRTRLSIRTLGAQFITNIQHSTWSIIKASPIPAAFRDAAFLWS